MLPTWIELNEKISEFEKKVDNAVNQKNARYTITTPALTLFIKATINDFIPFPFNEIARSIYDSSSSAGSSEQDAFLKIKQYFNDLQNNGEENYNKISSQLNAINGEIFNSRIVSVKESILQQLRDTLVTRYHSKQDTMR